MDNPVMPGLCETNGTIDSVLSGNEAKQSL